MPGGGIQSVFRLDMQDSVPREEVREDYGDLDHAAGPLQPNTQQGYGYAGDLRQQETGRNYGYAADPLHQGTGQGYGYATNPTYRQEIGQGYGHVPNPSNPQGTEQNYGYAANTPQQGTGQGYGHYTSPFSDSNVASARSYQPGVPMPDRTRNQGRLGQSAVARRARQSIEHPEQRQFLFIEETGRDANFGADSATPSQNGDEAEEDVDEAMRARMKTLEIDDNQQLKSVTPAGKAKSDGDSEDGEGSDDDEEEEEDEEEEDEEESDSDEEEKSSDGRKEEKKAADNGDEDEDSSEDDEEEEEAQDVEMGENEEPSPENDDVEPEGMDVDSTEENQTDNQAGREHQMFTRSMPRNGQELLEWRGFYGNKQDERLKGRWAEPVATFTNYENSVMGDADAQNEQEEAPAEESAYVNQGEAGYNEGSYLRINALPEPRNKGASEELLSDDDEDVDYKPPDQEESTDESEDDEDSEDEDSEGEDSEGEDSEDEDNEDEDSEDEDSEDESGGSNSGEGQGEPGNDQSPGFYISPLDVSSDEEPPAAANQPAIQANPNNGEESGSGSGSEDEDEESESSSEDEDSEDSSEEELEELNAQFGG